MNPFLDSFQGRWRAGRLALWGSLAALLALAGAANARGEGAGAGQAAAGQVGVKETTPMPTRRQMHGAAVLGDRLYVVGGVIGNEQYTAATHMATILPDSSLGPWSETTPLPKPRAYIANSTLALNDMIYVIGGIDGLTDEKFNTAIWARPGPDGSLSAWEESAPFPGPGLSNLTVVSTPGFLHILGGSTGDRVPTRAVISGGMDAQGRLAWWEPGPPLPEALWFHNSVAVAGRVYVWGGRTAQPAGPAGTTVSARVYSSPILSTGRLGPWREEAPLPAPLYSAAGAAAGPFLLMFCPRDASFNATNDAWFASVTPQGLSPWGRASTALPMRLYVAAAPDYRRGVIYIPGGRIDPQERDESVDNRVFYFQLTPSVRQASETQLAYAHSGGEAQTAPGAPGESVTAADAPPQPTAIYTYLASERTSQQAAAPGFLTFTQARMATLQGPPKPVALYFNIAGAKPCERQKEMLNAPEVQALAQNAILAWVENREWPQLAQQLGIYRCPAWVIYNPRGVECGRHYGALTPAQIAQGIQSCQ